MYYIKNAEYCLLFLLTMSAFGCGMPSVETVNNTSCVKPRMTMHVTYFNKETVFEESIGEFVEIDSEGRGSLCATLYPAIAPKTVQRIKTLVENGYYDNMYFHRVVEAFIVQIGHSRCKTTMDNSAPSSCGGADTDSGSGFGRLLSESRYVGYSAKAFSKGSMSMALKSAGEPSDSTCVDGGAIYHKDSADAQFFICNGDCNHLNNCFTVFGQLKSGFAYLNYIQEKKSRILDVIYEP